MEKLESMTEEIRRMAVETLPLTELSDSELEEQIEYLVSSRPDSVYLTIAQKAETISAVISSIRGLGILDSLLYDEGITEIMVNSFDMIFIERKGILQKTDLRFESEKQLSDVIQRIVGMAGREVNQANQLLMHDCPTDHAYTSYCPHLSYRACVDDS